ncbi:hypothetical protein TNCV_595561 [Trichonephila clavipes]|nr:hypothetical protein TNCV_595561 [Trichonephila clavipes]
MRRVAGQVDRSGVPLEIAGSSGHEKGSFLNGLPRQFSSKIMLVRIQQKSCSRLLRHFRLLPWPARSTDLSPVEPVWYQLKTADAIVSLLYMI